MGNDELLRFHGMGQKRIAKLLALDEHARRILGRGYRDPQVALAHLQQRFQSAGFDFTPSMLLEYAVSFGDKQEIGGRDVFAANCYRVYSEYTGNDGPLRRHLVELGWYEQAKQQCALTRENHVDIGNALLARARRSGVNAAEGALEAFTAVSDRDGIRRVLRFAVSQGFIGVALHAAAELQIHLTRPQLLRLGQKALKRHRDVAKAFIIEHQLKELYHPMVSDYLIAVVSNFSDVKKLADQLNVTLGLKAVVRFFEATAKRLGYRSVVDVAEYLATRSVEWRRYLPRVYEEAKREWINFHQSKKAERFGRLCGKPLTIQELQQLIEEYLSMNEDSYRRHYESEHMFSQRLLARRIAQAVRPRAPKKSRFRQAS